jgi:hypothetical protein
MRWLVACLVLASSATASARVVRRIEPLVERKCPRAASWERVEKCLAELAQPTVLRTLPHARVVELTKPLHGEANAAGVYLYVEHGEEWRLGGLLQNESGDVELLAAQAVTLNHHHGFQLEIGEVKPTLVSLDQIGAVRAVLSQVEILYCSGDDWRCTTVVRACDVFVGGKALWSFRGKATVIDNEIHVVGNRSNIGAECTAPERGFLSWSANE